MTCKAIFSQNIFQVDITDLLPEDEIVHVSIPDGEFRKKWLEKRSDYVPKNPITNVDMLKLTTLSVPENRNISNLKGLEHAIYLQYITIVGNSIQDMSPLRKLEYLKGIRLLSNHILKIPNLERLTNLRALQLGHNKIKNITPLRNLGNLRELKVVW